MFGYPPAPIASPGPPVPALASGVVVPSEPGWPPAGWPPAGSPPAGWAPAGSGGGWWMIITSHTTETWHHISHPKIKRKWIRFTKKPCFSLPHTPVSRASYAGTTYLFSHEAYICCICGFAMNCDAYTNINDHLLNPLWTDCTFKLKSQYHTQTHFVVNRSR